ncbi:hypothetical protein GCM10009836_11810 [Pseudonocardia ailaonensis]|uniref:Mycothiol-dependent maleylpyruvate isomerase metal-binding domain-containing protein n=1 Tax=Pseudonocardia ailaonensis TaxID=367279 RepID=A0ABN2MR93_9PSEU
MLPGAECLVEAERVMGTVLDGVRPDQWRTRIPPLPDSPDPTRPTALDALVRHHIARTAALVDLLAGREHLAGDVLPPHREELPALARQVSEKACAAVAGVEDEDAPVGPDRIPAGAFLWREAVGRALLAHEVSIHRGSVNPLTEGLARALYDHVTPDLARWQETGVFGQPVEPVPADVSWRDRFVMVAGHDPHPLWDR